MTRKQFISMAQRRVREGSGRYGQGPDPEHWKQVVPPIQRYLGEVLFLIIGGLATRLYMPERMTLDLDILVNANDYEEVKSQLTGHGCEMEGPLTIGGDEWLLPDGSVLDVIPLRGDWVEEAMNHPVTGPDKLPYIALEYLVIMKLHASRPQDLADISRMLGAADETALDRVRSTAQRYIPSDLEDIESLIQLGRLEQGS